MYNQFMTELRVREAAALNVRERVREMKIDRKLVKPHYGHAAKWEYLSLARNQELEFPTVLCIVHLWLKPRFQALQVFLQLQ